MDTIHSLTLSLCHLPPKVSQPEVSSVFAGDLLRTVAVVTSHHISALAAWSPVPRSEEGLTHKLWQKEDFHAKSWKSKTTQLKIRVETKLGEKDKLGIWAGMMEERWCGQSINKQRRNE